MKVERKGQPKYVPIIITLEKEEEARYFWHILNCPTATAFRDYCEEEGLKFNHDMRLEVFSPFGDIYKPEDDC